MADNYKAWEIDANDFPYNGTIEKQIKFLCGYGILAPSTHNTQPWILKFNDASLTIKPNHKRQLEQADPKKRGLYISLGAFLENVITASTCFGLDVEHKVDKSGTISLNFNRVSKVQTIVNPSTLALIKNRSSYKRQFVAKEVSKETVSKLKESAGYNELRLVQDSDQLKSIIDLHMTAAEKTANNPKFVRELATWLRPNKTRSKYGMPGFVMGFSNLQSFLAPKLLKNTPAILKKGVHKDRALLEFSSLIAVFGIIEDKIEESINCGRAIENFWLNLEDNGLVAHPMIAIINEEPENRKLENLLEMKSQTVFMMRIGYGTGNKTRTPRDISLCS